MFVADVKCSQATWQTVPNSRTGSAKASVSKAIVYILASCITVYALPSQTTILSHFTLSLRLHP